MKAALLTAALVIGPLIVFAPAADTETAAANKNVAAPAGTSEAVSNEVDPTRDVQDLILLGPTYPLRLRLHLEVSGTPFRDVWRKAVEQNLDRLGAGKYFSPIQITALAKQLGETNLAALEATKFDANAKSSAMSAKEMQKNGNLTRDAALRMLQSIAPLAVQNRLASRGAGAALFPLLDRDGDGRLSSEELDAATASLRCRDFNDDLLFTEQELIQGPPRAGQNGSDPAAADGVVLLVNSTAPLDSLAESLLYRYDRNRDGKLAYATPPVEIRFPTDQYAKLDKSGDQMLDREELTALLESPPDVELHFQLGQRRVGARRENKISKGAEAIFEVRRKLDGGYRLSMAGNEINLRRNNRDPSQAADPPRLRTYDQNNDGMLTAEELPEETGIKFTQVDRDGDGKVAREEFDEYHRRQISASGARIVLTVSDQGQDLFTRLDQNGDQILSPRELTTARQILTTDDADRDGYVSNYEIPYNITLELSRGDPSANSQMAMLRQPRREPQPAKPPAKAPEWFNRMDRNGDGELSPAEFLGGRETFDRLDSNHDGLLEAAEADHASM
jgi:Ca2+-binding EF-hand superfamily protein